ncbi:MAG TPA: CoA transferase [Hyphomicrobiaceae bacterium]|jgi:crotonobetainyl-CoA:carnitine CoA-transferase CaiB-like acyl-CoA transferase|nr:CoA transferase [Hyphomicrobiaceae bacterium]
MKPLEGTRILTVEQFGAGPYGSMFLADLGAEVIKVENAGTGGDTARSVGPRFLGEADSEYFQSINTNKRSITLDLKSEDGRQALRRLAATADALMNNLRGDQPEKLGLDYQSLAAVNSAIVCLHISAYGRDNARKAWPGYDFLMQAEAGLMTLTGEPDGPPQRFGASLIDFLTGMSGIVGLLSCIMRARKTGTGCDVDISLFDVAMHQLSYPGTWYINGGPVPSRLARSAHQSISPVQTVRTRDGWIYVMCMKEKFWETLAGRIGHPEYVTDPRFATADARRQHRAELTRVLDEAMSQRTTAEWLAVLTGHLPVGPVYDVGQAVANPFVDTVGMVRTVPHPSKPDFKMLANPLKIDGQRLEQRVCAPLGADNEALLGPATRKAAAEQGRP